MGLVPVAVGHGGRGAFARANHQVTWTVDWGHVVRARGGLS